MSEFVKQQKDGIFRFLEMVPGAVSWLVIIVLIVLAVFKPVISAVLIITFEFYWIIRTLYLTTLLFLAHRRLIKQKNKDWLKMAQRQTGFADIFQLVIFPVYKEGLEILRPSLDALKQSRYPLERMIVVVSFEERHRPSRQAAEVLENEFKGVFFGYITTFHPDGIPGEGRLKGANATWAAQRAKEFIEAKKIPPEKVIVSCFDADTVCDKGYFGCLAYHFLSNPSPHQASYQPIPVYNNNIWHAPSFARVVEMSGSFSQMIESMRLEKFVTFSSHSMSFKTLVEIDYWPVDMISDDSVIYWKGFLHYKGRYRVIPLYTTVSMDAAYGKTFLSTITLQYKQKRRWAWGVENFPYVVRRFLREEGVPLSLKLRRSFHLFESHITWAIWAVILILIAPLPMLLGGVFFREMPIGFNLPHVTGILFNFTLGTSIVWVTLSRAILPPRPKGVSWLKHLLIAMEWVIAPFIIIILGSTPALDAQTRLLFGRDMQFFSTEKRR
jgi:cellulose synthase/poly-beta-1,6-N-acetylglucosamine synthase-like glycosyltransferase